MNVGFDNMAQGSDARFVEINVDGPSAITARVSDVSGGTVRVCIIRQDRDIDTVCNPPRTNDSVEIVVNEEGQSVWLIQAQGRGTGAAPSGNLTITFNSLVPVAQLRSFRYNGTVDPSRNGFTARLSAAADGEIAVRGNFEDRTFNYRVTIQPCSDPMCDQSAMGANFEAIAPGVAGTDYTISVASPEETTGGSAFVQATISWQ